MRRTTLASMSALLTGVLALTLIATDEAPQPPRPPTDYIAIADTLSQPDFPETVREAAYVPMAHDGTQIYVEVVRPDPELHGEGPWPVIMEISPYHGPNDPSERSGGRIFPDDPGGLTGYFAPRGYAVVMVDLRGTGRSHGCLDHLGPNDAKDMKAIVEWAAHPDRSWSQGEWNRVGLTGHSYVGSTPSIAATQHPRGLATIAPSAGLVSMYDHQFQWGVPYFLQWAGPMVAYELLTFQRYTDDYPLGPDNAAEFGCGVPNSSLTAGHGQVTGEYQAWHAARDWSDETRDIDVPVFIIHGVNDNAARIPAAEWFFGERFDRPEDKVWIGQWNHGSSAHVNRRFDQWKYALHAWFDKHLKGRDVDTGPPVEAFLGGGPSGGSPDMGPVYTAETWERPEAHVTLYPDATDMSLGTEPPTEDASVAFRGLAGLAAQSRVTFTSEPFEEDTTLLGLPDLQLNASVSGQSMHLVTILSRVTPSGQPIPMNYCAINPQLRYDRATPAPIVPTVEMELHPQCFTMAHHVPAGDAVQLEVTTTSAHHAPTLAVDANITVETGPLKTNYAVPRVPDAVLHDDVPSLRED